MQILFDKGFFDTYDNADALLKKFLFTRRRPDLEEVNDNEIHWFCLQKKWKQGKKWHPESADPAKALDFWLCSNEQKREIND